MGAGSSATDRYVDNQERYVSKHLSSVKTSLPSGKYSDAQIKGRLRQEYCQSDTYREPNSWINDRVWNEAKLRSRKNTAKVTPIVSRIVG